LTLEEVDDDRVVPLSILAPQPVRSHDFWESLEGLIAFWGRHDGRRLVKDEVEILVQTVEHVVQELLSVLLRRTMEMRSEADEVVLRSRLVEDLVPVRRLTRSTEGDTTVPELLLLTLLTSFAVACADLVSLRRERRQKKRTHLGQRSGRPSRVRPVDLVLVVSTYEYVSVSGGKRAQDPLRKYCEKGVVAIKHCIVALR
jgi:hypothetical protein